MKFLADRQDRRATLLVGFVGVVAFLTLGLVTHALYRQWLPGVPDSGPVPFPVLPSLLFSYWSYFDPVILAVWLLACSVFFVPPALMVVLAERSWSKAIGFLLILFANAYGASAIWNIRMRYFYETPYSTEAGLRVLVRSTSFLLVLSLAGILLGFWLRAQIRNQHKG